jgi:hypothetical protein
MLCVDRYRGEFLDLMRNGTVGLVFANEAELHSLYQTADFDTALAQLRVDANLGASLLSAEARLGAKADAARGRNSHRRCPCQIPWGVYS